MISANKYEVSFLTFKTKAITIIFKDGTTATFENAIQWNKTCGKYEIFFVCIGYENDKKLVSCSYDVEQIATIIDGYVNTLI